MMKHYLFIFLFFTGFFVHAQVGINTTTPNAQLDIQSSNQVTPSNTDGILIPKIDTFPATNPTVAQQGMLVYLTTPVGTNIPGFYYWDNPTTSWVPIKGNDTGTLDQAYDFGGAGLGKTITADSGAVLINGTDGLVSTGTSGTGVLAPSGAGTRMVWNPRKAAFRAGTVTGTKWDDASIGNGSVAFGNSIATGGNAFAGAGGNAGGSFSFAFGGGAIASGQSSFAFGQSANASIQDAVALGFLSTASGPRAIALGSGVTASGQSSTAFGAGNTASGFASTAFGSTTIASGSTSTSFGKSNTAFSFGETVLGIGATTYTTSTNGDTQFRTANSTDRLFAIGNAIDADNDNVVDDAERSDAMVVLKNGNVGVGLSTPQNRLHFHNPTGIQTFIQLTNSSTGITQNDGMILGNIIGTSEAGIINQEPTNFYLGTSSDQNQLVLTPSGNVGVGTDSAQAKLHVEGNIRMVDGNQAAGKVLTSDANGTATWQNASANAWGLSGNAGTNPATNFVGTTDNNDLVLKTNNNDNFRIKNDGRIEIGNNGANPVYLGSTSLSKKLYIATESSTNNVVLQASNAAGDPVSIYFGGSRGTIAIPTISESNRNLSNLFFSGYDGTQFVNSSAINARIDGTPALNSMPGMLQFQTTPIGGTSPSTRMIINSKGNIGIGSGTPLERFHVFGKSIFTNGFSADNAALLYQNDTDYMFLGPQSGSSTNGAAMALFGSTNVSGGNAGGMDINVPNALVRMNHTNGNFTFGTNSTSGYTGAFELNDNGLEIGHNSASRAILFNPNSTERMRLTPAGNLGVGTNNPLQKVHVSGPAGLTAVRIANTSGTGSTSNVALDFFRNTAANTDWRIYNIGANLTIGNSGDDLVTVNDLYQFQGVRFMPMTDATISLGQGANRWNTLFASNGTINTSDAREKKNIQNLTYGLDELMQLRPVSFEWKKDDGSGTKLGLIAQELQQVLPEVVRDWDWEVDEQGNRKKVTSPILGVYYSDLIPVLIKATQEQQLVIEKQKEEIDLLKQQLQVQYQSILERLEKIENK
ncbi:MAG: hypothetical protein C0512_04525 [Flavobacterium sp.]|nr:hypothetical protein [Flavobacterium sp.]